MSEKLDKRILIAEIEIAGKLVRLEGLAMHFSVTKTAGAAMNEASIKIANLNKEQRDYLIMATSPLKRVKERKSVKLYAGYQSTGTALLFAGDVTAATPTQPPDIYLQMKAKTGFWSRGTVVANSMPAQAQLSNIAGQVAQDLGVALDFQAGDKKIDNWSFTGGAALQVDKLERAGLVNAYLDDDRLVVKDESSPLKGKLRKLSEKSGMIGIPEVTEQGIKVKMLYDKNTGVGALLEIESKLNPAANGAFVVHTAKYDLASHDTAFYIECEGRPQNWRQRFI